MVVIQISHQQCKSVVSGLEKDPFQGTMEAAPPIFNVPGGREEVIPPNG